MIFYFSFSTSPYTPGFTHIIYRDFILLFIYYMCYLFAYYEFLHFLSYLSVSSLLCMKGAIQIKSDWLIEMYSVTLFHKCL